MGDSLRREEEAMGSDSQRDRPSISIFGVLFQNQRSRQLAGEPRILELCIVDVIICTVVEIKTILKLHFG